MRQLLFVHHEELITDDECQDEFAILRLRAELARACRGTGVTEGHMTSVLATERGAG